MKKITEFYVTFWSPGLVFGEDRTEVVETADPDAVKWPDDAYCFTMHSREVVVDDDGARFVGKSKRIGPRYYHPDSTVLSLDEVKARPEFCRPNSFLVSNMEGNRWTHVVLTRWGNWPQDFTAGEDVVMAKASR